VTSAEYPSYPSVQKNAGAVYLYDTGQSQGTFARQTDPCSHGLVKMTKNNLLKFTEDLKMYCLMLFLFIFIIISCEVRLCVYMCPEQRAGVQCSLSRDVPMMIT